MTDMKRSGSSSTSSSTERRRKECVKCGELVGGSKRFVERDGIILCEKDWKKLYLPSCRRCSLPIEKSAVSSSDGQLKGKWHRHCFTCTKCDQPFQGDSFYVLAGKPWCQQHYHEEK
jgi:formylmethanofuran dehydrogenase subunit E